METIVRTSAAPSLVEQHRPRPLPAIAIGGVIVGILDLTYAIVVYSPTQPILIPHAIASGVLGQKSFEGGARTALLGVALHFVIAFGAAAVYYMASRTLPFLIRRTIPSGLIYGALVYVFMHYVVLPLSAVDHLEMPFVYKVFEFIEHWFFVGLPIALSVRYYSRET
jgi:hypothetical protein